MFWTVDGLKRKASEAARMGHYGDAAKAMERLVAKLPRDLGARQRLAEMLVQARRPEDAAAEYLQVASQYAVEGMALKAMAMCKAALAARPGHPPTEALLTQLVARKGAAPIHLSISAPPPVPVDGGEHSSDVILPGALLEDATGDISVEVTSVELLEDAVEEVTDSEMVDVVVQPDTLPPIPLFSDLAPQDVLEVFRRVNLRGARAGETLLAEGTPGDTMLIVVQGSVKVVRQDKLGQEVAVASMGEGAVVGELALLSRSLRLATVRAESDCVLMELSRDDVQAVIAQHPGVGAALDRFYKQRMMLNVLRGSPIFRALSDTTHDELLTASVLRTADKGELLVKQGAASGGLWLILRGRCEVASRTADGTIIGYPDMREGDVFGEISLALDAPATATVVAAAPSVLFMLPADAFNRVVRPNPQAAAALKGLGEVRLRRMGIDTALDLGT